MGRGKPAKGIQRSKRPRSCIPLSFPGRYLQKEDQEVAALALSHLCECINDCWRCSRKERQVQILRAVQANYKDSKDMESKHAVHEEKSHCRKSCKKNAQLNKDRHPIDNPLPRDYLQEGQEGRRKNIQGSWLPGRRSEVAGEMSSRLMKTEP